MATETHVAGLALEVSERFLIQRCSWCGAVLLSYDYTRVSVAGDKWEKPGHFEPNKLVRFSYDGPVARWGEVGLSRTTMEVLDDEKLPEDACALNLPLED